MLRRRQRRTQGRCEAVYGLVNDSRTKVKCEGSCTKSLITSFKGFKLREKYSIFWLQQWGSRFYLRRSLFLRLANLGSSRGPGQFRHAPEVGNYLFNHIRSFHVTKCFSLYRFFLWYLISWSYLYLTNFRCLHLEVINFLIVVVCFNPISQVLSKKMLKNQKKLKRDLNATWIDVFGKPSLFALNFVLNLKHSYGTDKVSNVLVYSNICQFNICWTFL